MQDKLPKSKDRARLDTQQRSCQATVRGYRKRKGVLKLPPGMAQRQLTLQAVENQPGFFSM
ncbi:hypothetical protein A9Q88_13160 [Gammaproteobacteria bacterium 50_400_T64]|nr:hypothetical protein A9Q88_13160 [Gammaproteobacteria bacterium 50_400_T64]